jgi:hypothetical protein
MGRVSVTLYLFDQPILRHPVQSHFTIGRFLPDDHTKVIKGEDRIFIQPLDELIGFRDHR